MQLKRQNNIWFCNELLLSIAIQITDFYILKEDAKEANLHMNEIKLLYDTHHMQHISICIVVNN